MITLGAAIYAAAVTVCVARLVCGGALNWRDYVAVAGLTAVFISGMVLL